ncbi:MAG: hypothetical protein VKQ33_04670 [Candidatus Sericytochromatia bacterium]|nr:hypothetical protein [Candidatus Sericytochromatia bacterium]
MNGLRVWPLLLGAVAAGVGAAPGQALTTGGLGSPWLLGRGHLAAVPEAWQRPLHALGTLRKPGQLANQRPTLAVGPRWVAGGPVGPIPWARLRASGLRVVATGLRTRAEVRAWMALGVDGIGGDRPDVLVLALAALDRDGDGRVGDCLDAAGLPDPERVEVRGFAGARGLRPEGTLAGIEAALDVGVTALALPTRLTRDGRAVPALDAVVRAGKHRDLLGSAGAPWGLLGEGPGLASLTLAELRARYDRGVRLSGQPAQTLDPAASPVATAFAMARGWSGPHAYVSLDEVFLFLEAYAGHHAHGPGRLLPEAALRAQVAARVRVVAQLPAGLAGVSVGRACLEAARRAGASQRLTVSSPDPAVLTLLHREAPRAAVALDVP